MCSHELLHGEPLFHSCPTWTRDCHLPYGHTDLIGVLAVGVEVAVAVAHLLLTGWWRGVTPLAQVGLQAAASSGTAGCRDREVVEGECGHACLERGKVTTVLSDLHSQW